MKKIVIYGLFLTTVIICSIWLCSMCDGISRAVANDLIKVEVKK